MARSRHDIRLLALPARYWKWRMHGGAVTLAKQALALGPKPVDAVLATDMLDLSLFLTLLRRRWPSLPAALYMHENQLTYPLPKDPATGPMRRQMGERDQHYAFINFASALAADRVFFNSRFHLEEFRAALPPFLKRFPEHRELASVEAIQEKSSVLPVGIDPPEKASAADKRHPPLILWNQRWEYDKNPEEFFRALYWAQDQGLEFRLALCGERFSRQPGEFGQARRRLGERIVHEGFASADLYRRLLRDSALVLSTAIHEFFGISILEAISYGAWPVLPARLSYPELIPPRFHKLCLYEDGEGLRRLLGRALADPASASRLADELAPSMAQFGWQRLAPLYDRELEGLGKLPGESVRG